MGVLFILALLLIVPFGIMQGMRQQEIANKRSEDFLTEYIVTLHDDEMNKAVRKLNRASSLTAVTTAAHHMEQVVTEAEDTVGLAYRETLVTWAKHKRKENVEHLKKHARRFLQRGEAWDAIECLKIIQGMHPHGSPPWSKAEANITRVLRGATTIE